MAAHENNSPKTTTMFVQNRNDTSDDEEMSDAISRADAEHKRTGVSPIHIPADWDKTGSTGDDDSVCQIYDVVELTRLELPHSCKIE